MAAVLYNYLNGAKTLFSQMLYQRHNALKDIPHLDNKVAVVTGGNSGIGFETVRGLCRIGLSVIMACRSEEKAINMIAKLKEEQPEAKVKYMNLDLTSLDSIRDFAYRFRESESNLHILVNNAGVMLTPYDQTKDGFELQLGINHLGHFALTLLLLDIMKRSGSKGSCARIVTVSSSAHAVATMNFDDLQSRKHYNPYSAYSQSKLANVLFTYALQRRLTDEGCYVTANTLHPGVVDTNLFQHLPWVIRYPQSIMAKVLFLTPEQGASTSLYACLSPDLEGKGGMFLDNCQESKSNQESYDQDVQDKLWTASCELTGMEKDEWEFLDSCSG
ncbi:hypothetical protein QZH41_013080 [Actinostola sp. cb2023]|nr:hypothetical protein QZH41_013080 [Actinostola sp. cb2023]